MRKLLLIGLALVVVAGFGVCGWQLQQAREREAALTKRIDALERSAGTSQDGTKAIAKLLIGVSSRTGSLANEVSDLQQATFDGQVSTYGPSLDSRLTALEAQDERYTPVTDNTAQVTQLQMRLDRLCNAVRFNSPSATC
ncbi:hypothetical protein SAMN05421678_1317 [Actinopolymorpha cephalotaxi]|uniref:BMFP domain-containing protein YqiC n=1 Tax=Actinopolymorpha cephalotaxi TaxID=504797 RepID=A0A1I3CAM9_9ACTN|nr:hypothetical protein [Actinopolymorpha cephalotaxi]NYH86737.1 BMFP domain-containing protein YqiC [Actinopolymorpha cephalotaxi]SFH71493.1 hypothetical protein SAMN05421678_1317 [Actinopolymorpha cephalotaxi]